jgi:phosphoenolpyruvate-protein kinase (PTS system EI component)
VAVVARELGIPTVVQVPDVTRDVQTGQWLRVNGSEGTITVLGDAAGASTAGTDKADENTGREAKD